MLRNEIQRLMKLGLLESAEKLCSILLSVSSSVEQGSSQDFELYADIIKAHSDEKRALKYYRKALTVFSLGQGSGESSGRGDQSVHLKLKVARCLVALKDFSSALKELEAIPQEFRDVEVNALLGRLYTTSGLKRHAISCLKAAFEEEPFAVEIIESLVNIGVGQEELKELLTRSLRTMSVSMSTGQETTRADQATKAWLSDLGKALVSRRSCRFPECHAKFKELLTMFPNNSYILCQIGCAAHESGASMEAIQAFRAARRADGLLVEYMDIYAAALYRRGEVPELAKLCQELVNADTKRPETWACVALYTQLKDDAERALAFVEKAIQLAPKYAHAYRVKGNIFLGQQRSEQAVICFFQASSLERHIDAYRGLVDANISLRKTSEATAAAKEAVQALPLSAQSHEMLGAALISANMAKEAVEALNTALRLDPRNEAAALQLADVLIASGPQHYGAARALLSKTLSLMSSARLLTTLGRVLALLGEHSDAIEKLNTAITIASDPSVPMAELEKVEATLREGEPSATSDYNFSGHSPHSPSLSSERDILPSPHISSDMHVGGVGGGGVGSSAGPMANDLASSEISRSDGALDLRPTQLRMGDTGDLSSSSMQISSFHMGSGMDGSPIDQPDFGIDSGSGSGSGWA